MIAEQLRPLSTTDLITEKYGGATCFIAHCSVCRNADNPKRGDTSSKSADEAAERFSEQGWGKDRTGIYCPKCAAKRN